MDIANHPALRRLTKARIGDRFGNRANDNFTFSRMLKWFLSAPDFSLEQFLLEHYPNQAFVGRSGYGPEGTMTKLVKNVRALYWNGEEFETSVFPGAAVVADEYQAFARSLLRCLEGASNPLVVELGSGTGMVQFHVRQVAAETGQQVKFIGFEFNPYALLFSELIAERFGISIVNNMVDLAASIQDVGHLEEIRRRIHEAAEGRPIYVMTHGGLHPFFDDNFYCRLFPFLIDQVGVVGGVHEELIGFRTPAFSRLRAAVSEAPSIKSPFVDNRANPLGYLEENADKLDISMTRRIEIVAHFPNRHFPSFLSWERRGRPPGQHQ